MLNMQLSSVSIHFLNAYSMSVTANTTYMASYPKRPDITGAPDQVFKFDNLLDRLIGGIKANTISTIGTINPGSLCTQFLYAPQIYFNLANKPIAFIGNLSNKMSEFSLIKINVTFICLFNRSATKKTVTLSSCEAKLNAAVLCVQDMIYGKNLLESVGLKVQLLMVLEMDNKGAVDLIHSFSVGGCMRHINVKQCFLRELKEANQLIVNWIPGSENNADMLTKKLDGPPFKRYAEMLLGEHELEGGGKDTSKP